MKDKLSIRVSIFVGERQTKFRSWLWYENNFMSTFSADTDLWSGKQSLSNGRNKKASDEISPFIVPLQGSHYQLSDWNKCLLEKNISSAIGCILKMVNVSVASFASHGDFALTRSTQGVACLCFIVPAIHFLAVYENKAHPNSGEQKCKFKCLIFSQIALNSK